MFSGLNNLKVNKLMRNNRFLYDLKNNRLLNTLEVLEKVGITKEDIYKNPSALSYIDSTVEHNVMFLKEIGFRKVDASLLLR